MQKNSQAGMEAERQPADRFRWMDRKRGKQAGIKSDGHIVRQKDRQIDSHTCIHKGR